VFSRKRLKICKVSNIEYNPVTERSPDNRNPAQSSSNEKKSPLRSSNRTVIRFKNLRSERNPAQNSKWIKKSGSKISRTQIQLKVLSNGRKSGSDL
jgi:site-specific recombinase XerC